MEPTEQGMQSEGEIDVSGMVTPPTTGETAGQEEIPETDETSDIDRPKQLNYQHTKVYQASDGRFIIDQGCQESQTENQEEEADVLEKGLVEAGTEKKEQALRYLEAFASSVAEEMKKQAEKEASDLMQPDVSESIAEIRETIVGIPVNMDLENSTKHDINAENDNDDAQSKSWAIDETTAVDDMHDSTTDEAENPEDIGLESETESTVMVVIAEELITLNGTANCEETPLGPVPTQDEKSTLRRSKRKRRTKKRGYDDDDEEDSKEKAKQEEKNMEVDAHRAADEEEETTENGSSSRVLKPKNNEFKDSFTCETCGKIFLTNTQHKQHLRTHSEQKPHQCEYCPKSFRQKCQKDKHERTHTGSKPYKCRHCKRAFSESGSRNRHERIHTGFKPYKCQHCNKKFIQKGNKDAHEKIHKTYKPFRCFNKNCNDTFVSEAELQNHKEGHPLKPYRCHFCCKGFPFNAERKRHERCHTGVKPYKCFYCYKTFTQKGNKDNHERTHTGEKPHPCIYCSKGFIRKQYLEKHTRSKHGKEPPKEVMKPQHHPAPEQQPTVYAVLELDPSLPKEDRLAAESLLKAARIVAQHQVGIQSSLEGSSNIQAQQIGQVMAEVNQQLSSVEHHVAIVEHDGVQHQVQVVEHRIGGGEINKDSQMTVLEGQVVEEHEVIRIQDQVMFGEPKFTVSSDGQFMIQQHHITNEDGNMTIIEHQLPVVETNVSSNQQLQPNQFVGEAQEYSSVEHKGIVGEKHILVTSEQDVGVEEGQLVLANTNQGHGLITEDHQRAHGLNTHGEPQGHEVLHDQSRVEQEMNQFSNEVATSEGKIQHQEVVNSEQGEPLVIHGHSIVITAPE